MHERCNLMKHDNRTRRIWFAFSGNFSKTRKKRPVNNDPKRAYMLTFSRFGVLLRLRRRHEPSGRSPGRPSTDEVEASGYGSGRCKRKGPPRVEKRAAKRGEHSELQSWDDTILVMLDTCSIARHEFVKTVGYVSACYVRSW